MKDISKNNKEDDGSCTVEAIKEEIWSWLMDEESCVTVARIGQTFRVSRATAAKWLAEMPYFKSQRGNQGDATHKNRMLKYQVTEYKLTNDNVGDSKGVHETVIQLVQREWEPTAADATDDDHSSLGTVFALMVLRESPSDEPVETNLSNILTVAHANDRLQLQQLLQEHSDYLLTLPPPFIAPCPEHVPAALAVQQQQQRQQRPNSSGANAAVRNINNANSNSKLQLSRRRQATTAANFFANVKTTTTTTKSTTKETSHAKPTTATKTSTSSNGAASAKPPTRQTTTSSNNDNKGVSTRKGGDIQEEKENHLQASSLDSIKTNERSTSRGAVPNSQNNKIGNADDFVGDEDDEDEEDDDVEMKQPEDDADEEEVPVVVAKSKQAPRRRGQAPTTKNGSKQGKNHRNDNNEMQEDEEDADADDDDDDAPAVVGAMDAFAKPKPHSSAPQPPPTSTNRKRRKRLVERTTKDARGYIHTETQVVWEEVDDSEDEVMVQPAEKATTTTARTTTSKTSQAKFNSNKSSKSKGATGNAKKTMKQGSITGFFQKK